MIRITYVIVIIIIIIIIIIMTIIIIIIIIIILIIIITILYIQFYYEGTLTTLYHQWTKRLSKISLVLKRVTRKRR